MRFQFFQHVLLVLVFLASYASSMKLQQQSKVAVNEDVGDELTWGVWIDGRDAQLGPAAYGVNYSSEVRAVFSKLYAIQMPTVTTWWSANWWVKLWWWANWWAEEPKELEPVEVYSEIVDLLHASWRNYPNPGLTKGMEVETCTRRMPQSYAVAVAQGIMMKGTPCGTTMGNKTVMMPCVQKLFEEYSIKLAAARRPGWLPFSIGASTNKDDQLRALAWLLQNLAFLHPLADKNGRSRLCLLQYELRRLGIGRGTFMYNNNKDIYFETLDTYVAKIREGISMYARAATTKSNPWSPGEQKHHQEKFARSFDYTLSVCWYKWCKNNAGCNNTSVSFVGIHSAIA